MLSIWRCKHFLKFFEYCSVTLHLLIDNRTGPRTNLDHLPALRLDGFVEKEVLPLLLTPPSPAAAAAGAADAALLARVARVDRIVLCLFVFPQVIGSGPFFFSFGAAWGGGGGPCTGPGNTLASGSSIPGSSGGRQPLLQPARADGSTALAPATPRRAQPAPLAHRPPLAHAPAPLLRCRHPATLLQPARAGGSAESEPSAGPPRKAKPPRQAKPPPLAHAPYPLPVSAPRHPELLQPLANRVR